MKLPPHLATLPYRIHTNRELGLMLRGEKPLALFSDWYEQKSEVLERYIRLFDRQVEADRFVKREFIQHCPGLGWKCSHVFLYALPKEEWRIDAMIELRFSKSNWNADHERKFGQLLGYEDWQNEYWLEKHFRPPQA